MAMVSLRDVAMTVAQGVGLTDDQAARWVCARTGETLSALVPESEEDRLLDLAMRDRDLRAVRGC